MIIGALYGLAFGLVIYLAKGGAKSADVHSESGCVFVLVDRPL